jgi:hypothetical protein
MSERQRQHRPGALAEHGVGDGVGVDVEAIAGGSTSPTIASMRRNSAWCFNSSSLNRTSASSAIWSPNQCSWLSSSTLALMNRFDQPEDVRVGPALDLADEPPFTGDSVVNSPPATGRRQELVRRVEAASADDVLLDVPAHPLGRLNGARISLASQEACRSQS